MRKNLRSHSVHKNDNRSEIEDRIIGSIKCKISGRRILENKFLYYRSQMYSIYFLRMQSFVDEILFMVIVYKIFY